ncbi:MAG: hypothetical protein ACK42D_00325 [Candidatus Paceibacteria bacterium]
MRVRAEVLSCIILGNTLFAGIAYADCYCDQSIPLFEKDPLVTADAGIVSYVTPDMVDINEAGECYVDNLDGFFEEETTATFFFGGDEYSQVQVFRANGLVRWWWATMAELNDWALTQCAQQRPTS